MNMKTNPDYNKLLGALVGLVRATDGNEDMINDGTDSLVIEALRTDPETAALDEIDLLLHRITDEKRRLIPNCFSCEARCGRTDDYDTGEIYNAPDNVREAKLAILKNLQKIAKSAKDTPTLSSEIWETVYNAIFYLGLDLDQNALSNMLSETETAVLQLQ